MATIKLGMLVSNIAGSIGGTTFRRFRGGVQVYNKAKGASDSKTLRNPKIKQLNDVASSWKSLTATAQNNWKSAALLFSFFDKFGDPKFLTGFELYVKLFNFNKNIGSPLPDPTTLSNTVTTSNLSNIVLNLGSPYFIEFANVVANTTVIVRITQISNMSISPTFTNREIFYSQSIAVNKQLDFSTEFLAKFPNVKANEVFAVYYTFQNSDGFQSVEAFINSAIV